MARTFSRFPNEIIHGIARLTGNDVKDFRLVNKYLHGVVDPIMWDVYPVILHLNRENLHLGMSMLDEFNREPVQQIRMLEIKSLDPAKEHNPPRRFYTSNGSGTLTMHPPAPEDTEEVIEARNRLLDVLPGALSALKGLKSVRWSIMRTDPEWTHVVVLEALGSLPLLSDFQVSTNVSTLPLQNLRNGNLRRLAVSLTEKPEDKEVFVATLTAVLLHNPRIVDLQLDISRAWTDLSFQDVFREIPPQSLQLRSLLLNGWSVEVTSQLLPHLRPLRSLNIQSGWRISQFKFWESLRSHTLHMLRSITVDQTSDDFMSYLESSPALEELNMCWAGANTDEGSDRLARHFYHDIFPRHRESVRRLDVSPALTGMWTIGLQNVDTFDNCKNLTHLTVGLDPDDIKPGENEEDIVASLVSRVANNLPEVSELVLRTVSPKGFRNARCGTGRFMAKQRIRHNILAALEKASYPAGCLKVHVAL
ncbi:hypothetical protein L218DRAFT_982692 [Marasmius fiardii PR-910]|nr:hypothetical protein L218DRAFT_982692 [Marasmius fiardii PR-910]